MKEKKGLRWLCGIFILLIVFMAGCLGQPDNGANGVSEQEESIIEDEQTYILLNHNPKTKKIFMESVETRLQKMFKYDKTPNVSNRDSSISLEQLQPGELLQITYTQEDILTEIKIAKDTFIYEGIMDFSVNVHEKTIVVDGSWYKYDENLMIFSDARLIPINELEKAKGISIRGRKNHILTLVAEGLE